ncbi:helix-turn-helix domain-containing protein [Dapis sp. BLCC M229]|uniref:helix-turn-helix domain-containing protein n=1 Tax=Dapis sp. BLCC M229 TaxID=3400188 RepID=UPI003CE8D09C
MARPYSRDLRIRVIRAYQNQEGSQRQIAQRFQVSLTFVRNLLRHYRTTGTVNPKQHGGGPKIKIDGNFDSLIQQQIQQKPDILLCELCEYLEIRTGVKVSVSTMYRILKKFNISRKKKSLCFRARERRY